MALKRDIILKIFLFFLSTRLFTCESVIKRHFARYPFHFKSSTKVFTHTLFNLPPFSNGNPYSISFWVKFANQNYSKYFWIQINNSIVLTLHLDNNSSSIDMEFFQNVNPAIKIIHRGPKSEIGWSFISIQLKDEGGNYVFTIGIDDSIIHATFNDLPQPDELKIIFCNIDDFKDNLCHL